MCWLKLAGDLSRKAVLSQNQEVKVIFTLPGEEEALSLAAMVHNVLAGEPHVVLGLQFVEEGQGNDLKGIEGAVRRKLWA